MKHRDNIDNLINRLTPIQQDWFNNLFQLICNCDDSRHIVIRYETKKFDEKYDFLKLSSKISKISSQEKDKLRYILIILITSPSSLIYRQKSAKNTHAVCGFYSDGINVYPYSKEELKEKLELQREKNNLGNYLREFYKSYTCEELKQINSQSNIVSFRPRQ